MKPGCFIGRLAGRRIKLFGRRAGGLSKDLLAKFAFLWTGKYDDGDLDNDLGDGVIEVTLPEVISNGYLYNWYAATDVRNITSSNDWSVPSDAEWTTLEDYLIANGYNYDDTITGNKIAKSVSGIRDWDVSSVEGAVGNDDYSTKRNLSLFNAFAAGRRGIDGSFSLLGQTSYFLSSTFDDPAYWLRRIDYNRSDVRRIGAEEFTWGFSLRLVRSAEVGDPENDGDYCDPYVGNNGQSYKTVRIGTQVWTAENLVETKYRNDDDIANVTDNAAWAALETGAYCAYDNDEDNVTATVEMWDTKYIPDTEATFAIPGSWGGFSDWYLPSLDELSEMHDELHLEGIGDFQDTGMSLYYSSSEYSATSARTVDFGSGATGWSTKDNLINVRPCRSFVSSDVYSLRDEGPARGWIFHITDNGDETFTYLEASATDFAETARPWSNIVDAAIGTTGTAIGTGQANTTAIIGQAGHTGSAANDCDGYVSTGYAVDGDDAFWVVEGVRQQVTFDGLIGTSTLRTFVKYTNYEPYRISILGILKPDAVLTEGDIDELNKYFKLWMMYFGELNPKGYWKNNRILVEE